MSSQKSETLVTPTNENHSHPVGGWPSKLRTRSGGYVFWFGGYVTGGGCAALVELLAGGGRGCADTCGTGRQLDTRPGVCRGAWG